MIKDEYGQNPYLMYKDLSIKYIENTFKNLLTNNLAKPRNAKLYTGTGGMDIFEESMENQIGFSRMYIGKKVPRILRLTGKIYKSYSGKYYKKVKI